MYRVNNQQKYENNGIFVNAAGGTGKSFILNMLLDTVRSEGKIALAVASSGIADTVLNGGRTAHNMFKIPLMEYNEIRGCSVKKNSELAKLLEMTSLIVWDEIVMANKNTLTALDITLRDILGNERFMGGKVFVCAGDFRQILPVIRGGGKCDELEHCIKSSYMWRDITKLELTENVRLRKAIISPTNDDVDSVNSMIQKKTKGEEKTYFSVDTPVEEGTDVQTSVFNALTSPSLPPHQLKVKIGSVVMVVRNISPPKLCNGSRVLVTNLKTNIIIGKTLGGSHRGEQVMIPRITLEASDTPVNFKRKQFPVKLSYAMTINKSQGQTFNCCGVLLDTVQCFAHGQLYVACSRVTSWDSLFIYTGWHKVNESYRLRPAVNCVYEELLSDNEVNSQELPSVPRGREEDEEVNTPIPEEVPEIGVVLIPKEVYNISEEKAIDMLLPDYSYNNHVYSEDEEYGEDLRPTYALDIPSDGPVNISKRNRQKPSVEARRNFMTRRIQELKTKNYYEIDQKWANILLNQD
ncbi:ATP-dependent DNA helicase Pif1-like [Oratosquilla oratoria]|uniref:ATP-dependent DNA helicase Pif1-like n=1 Tax=Oratosquilla oratoria TaxID=337810 RepID=UPI003F76E72B